MTDRIQDNYLWEDYRTPASELCREHGMGDAASYKLRANFGGMDVSMMARLKELEDENRRLKKKMYAGVHILVTPAKLMEFVPRTK